MNEKQADKTQESALKHRAEVKDLAKNYISVRIRERIDQIGLQQNDLAKELRVSAQMVNTWVSKKNAQCPDVLNLYKIAQALDVPMDYLCGADIKEQKKQKKIESIKDLLQSIWDQYDYCHANGIKVDFKKDKAQLSPNSEMFGTATPVVVDPIIQKFYRTLETFSSSCERGDIDYEILKESMEKQIELLPSKYEEGKDTSNINKATDK